MKTAKHSMPLHWLHKIGIVTIIGTLALPTMHAQEDSQREAYRASMIQNDVKRDAAAIQAELTELREQMRQLMPEDVSAVTQAIQRIQELTDGEMNQAIVSLQEASQSADSKDQGSKIAAALRNQGVVSQDLKQLSVDLQARETIDGMNIQLRDLIRREVAVMLEISRLGKIQQTPEKLRDRHQERFQTANEDQKGVTADVKRLSQKFEILAKDFPSGEHPGLHQAAALAATENLTAAADQAGSLTAAGPFNNAVTAQTNVIRTLVAMRQALNEDADPLEIMRELSNRLEGSFSDQKQVMDAVMLIGERQDLDRNLKRLQESLGDEVVATRFELEFLNRKASGHLLSAQDSMDKAQLNFIRMWEEHMDARVNTEDALEGIRMAQQTLSEQIAKLEAEKPKTPAQMAAALAQLQRDVAQAAMQQAQTANQPGQPPQQQAMQEHVDNLQQRALPISPEASNLLVEAANQLTNATPQAQAEAAQTLNEAAQELANQQAELQALARMQDQLERAQELAEQAQNQLETNQTAQAANTLNAAQNLAEAAQQAAMEAAPEAAQALAEAAQNLDQADLNAAQRKTQEAQSQAQAASAAMAEAQAAIAQMMSQMPGMGPAGPGMQVSEQTQGQGENPTSQGNAGAGPTGDNLAGAGEIGGPVELLTGLTPHERGAVTQLQNESPPSEFIPEVHQYYKNIADGAGLP